MRAIEHGVVFVHRGIGFLAAEDEARYLGRASVTLREQLVDAGARPNLATGGQWCAREQIASLRTMNISLLRFLVVEPADEQHLLAKIGERREHFPNLHALAFALGPPFLAVKAVAGKQHG